ncbi:MAG: hypothetical protein OIF58_09455 [Cohaesibacter sp.]|nr:hypothetical protein [Cohaesibacter sp.]
MDEEIAEEYLGKNGGAQREIGGGNYALSYLKDENKLLSISKGRNAKFQSRRKSLKCETGLRF